MKTTINYTRNMEAISETFASETEAQTAWRNIKRRTGVQVESAKFVFETDEVAEVETVVAEPEVVVEEVAAEVEEVVAELETPEIVDVPVEIFEAVAEEVAEVKDAEPAVEEVQEVQTEVKAEVKTGVKKLTPINAEKYAEIRTACKDLDPKPKYYKASNRIKVYNDVAVLDVAALAQKLVLLGLEENVHFEVLKNRGDNTYNMAVLHLQ